MNPLAPLEGSGSPPVPVPAQAALLVVDMQNAYCHPEGVFARHAENPRAFEPVITACAAIIAAARSAGVAVIYAAKVSLAPSVPTASFHNTARSGAGLMQAGDWDAAIVDNLRPQAGDIVLAKPAFSAFFGTALDTALTRLGVRRLIVAGVTTSICVESTVRDAAQRALDVYVVRDATAEWQPERHERSIEQMGYAFARIVTAQDLERAWRAPRDLQQKP